MRHYFLKFAAEAAAFPNVNETAIALGGDADGAEIGLIVATAKSAAEFF